MLILGLLSNFCFAGVKAKKEVKRGNLLYNKGKFEEALKKYKEASSEVPDSDVVNFNMGTALYKMGEYEKAMKYFQKSLVSDNPRLEQKASYNLGNAKYKYGMTKKDTDLPGTVDLLKQALRHYEYAIELDAEDKDAKYNYEFVKKELERLEKELNQQRQKAQSKTESKEPKSSRELPSKQTPQNQSKAQMSNTQDEQGAESSDIGEKEEKQMGAFRGEREREEGKKGASKQRGRTSQPGETMSKEEALMLLEGYHQEEEPKGLYKEKIPTHQLPEVLKDW